MKYIFISDLHLEEDRPERIDAFEQFATQEAKWADALFILGDFFEAWIGDDYTSPLIERVIDLFHIMSSHGVKIFFMQGNRDFLVGEDFAKKAHCQLLAETHILQINNQKILLMHGDSLCTNDLKYMAFRKIARDPDWQATMLAKPLAERIQIAKAMRQMSKMSNANSSESIGDVNPQEVLRVMTSFEADILIHGHTHRPAIHDVQLKDRIGKRIVLGDWDKTGWLLKFSEAGYHLKNFPITPVVE